jgi:glycerophosphoryl diester phosphodiesterase
MKLINRLLLVMFISLAGACEKINYHPDNPIAGISTKVLMHKGCGYNTDIPVNTLAAAEYGLSLLDGIELDIQLSKDGTLWLDHDNEVYNCDSTIVGCFQELTDEEIRTAGECGGVNQYDTLESVFQLMVSKYPNSFISLDIKGQYCEIANSAETMRTMANAVLALVDKYHMQNKVLVESSSPAFLNEFENQKTVAQCIITVSGDVDEGMANAASTKARGISLKYGVEEFNSRVVSLIHQKGYGIMIWYINEPEDIAKVWTYQPDLIQTDNPDFKKYIPKAL